MVMLSESIRVHYSPVQSLIITLIFLQILMDQFQWAGLQLVAMVTVRQTNRCATN